MQLGEVFSKQEKLNDLQKNNTLFKSVGLAFQDLVIAEVLMHNL
jgi:ornithine cyclodeaminase/alanine dehydrogenase-like protein (mu-crystallin family)